MLQSIVSWHWIPCQVPQQWRHQCALIVPWHPHTLLFLLTFVSPGFLLLISMGTSCTFSCGVKTDPLLTLRHSVNYPRLVLPAWQRGVPGCVCCCAQATPWSHRWHLDKQWGLELRFHPKGVADFWHKSAFSTTTPLYSMLQRSIYSAFKYMKVTTGSLQDNRCM